MEAFLVWLALIVLSKHEAPVEDVVEKVNALQSSLVQHHLFQQLEIGHFFEFKRSAVLHELSENGWAPVKQVIVVVPLLGLAQGLKAS